MKPDQEQEIKKIHKKVKARVEEEKAKYEVPVKEEKLSHQFILDCLNANEDGDGVLYAALHEDNPGNSNRDKLLWNCSTGEWYVWAS